ncbi:uncharacterized protein LOC100369466 [Saccoglossus kowalevskii]|uniref:Uncharacterized protein LOC100369466 n=1 Tax=Saccoglossus kowalevskii TaxID=10224 RepID=A0ABM0GP40_SACKO|nr:PREDICTED: uncharacterized protein LOC100369466 [Saccoglossus kowalevskii]
MSNSASVDPLDAHIAVDDEHPLLRIKDDNKRGSVFVRVIIMCGVAQLIIGTSLLIVGILIASKSLYSKFYNVGTPIACGIVFEVTGISGWLASYKKSKSTIRTCMVLSFISILLSYVLCVISFIALSRNDPKESTINGFVVTACVLEFIISIISYVFCRRAMS